MHTYGHGERQRDRERAHIATSRHVNNFPAGFQKRNGRPMQRSAVVRTDACETWFGISKIARYLKPSNQPTTNVAAASMQNAMWIHVDI